MTKITFNKLINPDIRKKEHPTFMIISLISSSGNSHSVPIIKVTKNRNKFTKMPDIFCPILAHIKYLAGK